MRKSRKKKHRIESSKKIVIFCDALTTVTIIMTFAGWFLGHELSGMDVIVPAVIGLSAAAHSFYYVKARTENSIRLKREYDLKFEEMRQLNSMGDEQFDSYTDMGGNGYE